MKHLITLFVFFFIKLLKITVITLIVLIQAENAFSTSTTSTPHSLNPKDITHLSGLRQSHISLSGNAIHDLSETLSAGGCLEDFDNDGWMDLLFIAGSGNTRFHGKQAWWSQRSSLILYKNQTGRWQPQKINTEILKKINALKPQACLVVDFNNDKLPDILLLNQKEDVLLKNLDDFNFSEVSEFSNKMPNHWSTHATVFDINQDGLLDIFISRYIVYHKSIKRFEGRSGFSEAKDSHFSPKLFDGISNQLLINQGNFKFSDQTESSGLSMHQERSIASVGHISLDRRFMHLIIHNDGSQPLRHHVLPIHSNNLSRSEEIKDGHNIQDSRFHINQWNLPSSDNASLLYFSRKQGFDTFLKKDLVFRNSNSKFNSLYPGHHHQNWSLSKKHHLYLDNWSIQTADLNNDGITEFFVANGQSLPDSFSKYHSVAQANSCYWYDKSKQRYLHHWCDQNSPSSSRSLVSVDINNDGWLELLTFNNNDYPNLLAYPKRVWSENKWINFNIPLNEAWGAELQVQTPLRAQRFTVTHKSSLFGQADPRLHVGVGNVKEAKITLTSLSGEVLFDGKLNTNTFYLWKKQNFHPVELTYQEIPNQFINLSWSDFFYLFSNHEVHPSWLNLMLEKTLKESFSTPSQLKNFQELILETQSPHFLHIYLELTKHPNSMVQKTIFNTLKSLEMEQAVKPLLTIYLGAKADISCHVTDIFKHWFIEEEAVIRSKNLAIPLFIKKIDNMLRDIDALSKDQIEKVICSIDALGEADHISAAQALNDILDALVNQKKSHLKQFEVIALQLIKSIGHLRSSNTSHVIQKTMNSKHSPKVVAEGIIALSRLGDIEAKQWLDLHAEHIKTDNFQSKTLKHLANHPDHLILDDSIRKFLQPLEDSDFIEYFPNKTSTKTSYYHNESFCQKNHNPEKDDTHPLYTLQKTLFCKIIKTSPPITIKEIQLLLHPLTKEKSSSQIYTLDYLQSLTDLKKSSTSISKSLTLLRSKISTAIYKSRTLPWDIKYQWAKRQWNSQEKFTNNWLSRTRSNNPITLLRALITDKQYPIIFDLYDVKDIIKNESLELTLINKLAVRFCFMEKQSPLSCMQSLGL